MAPSVEGEMPWEGSAAPVGAAEVVEESVEVGDDVEDEEVGGGVIEEVGGEVGVAEVGVGVEDVDGGGVRPPYVHTPSVPSGIW